MGSLIEGGFCIFSVKHKLVNFPHINFPVSFFPLRFFCFALMNFSPYVFFPLAFDIGHSHSLAFSF
jgi:hypothetical protein